VCARNQLLINQWLLGYPDSALATLGDALRLAAQLNHPMTTNVLFIGGPEIAADCVSF
jgi:hypothetical protein